MIDLLKGAWESFEGHDDNRTEAWKLDRAERIEWEPPFLRFVLERHGGARFGSVRAELHYWCVDLENLSAGIYKKGWRSLRPSQ